jgi:HSP20 family protein
MDRIFEGFSPQIDSVERDGKLIIRADLPGMTKDDVKVEITGQAVVIDGERKYDRSYGRFHREIPLPDGAKTDKAAATFKNGVLEVTVEAPAGSTNRRQIKIHGEEAA